MAQFAIENLTFSYPTDPEHPSLKNVTLHVEQGEYIALCGKSGSGKTTLLRHLKSVLTPHGNREGVILYDGAPLEQADLRRQSSEIGFVYFSQRIKRMIITSGYNVYPGQLENIIDGHEKVLLSCVIGVKDPYKMQKVKAFVVLRPGCEPSDAVKQEILDYCRQHIAKYAMPYDIEFRPELPKTLVGKVAYRVLEEEEAERQAAEDANNS